MPAVLVDEDGETELMYSALPDYKVAKALAEPAAGPAGRDWPQVLEAIHRVCLPRGPELFISGQLRSLSVEAPSGSTKMRSTGRRMRPGLPSDQAALATVSLRTRGAVRAADPTGGQRRATLAYLTF